MDEPRWHASLADVMAMLDPAERAAYAIRHGTMRAGVYAPVGTDDQTPHDQDELYIVAAGSAQFVRDGTRIAVAAQDMLFVPAAASTASGT